MNRLWNALKRWIAGEVGPQTLVVTRVTESGDPIEWRVRMPPETTAQEVVGLAGLPRFAHRMSSGQWVTGITVYPQECGYFKVSVQYEPDETELETIA